MSTVPVSEQRYGEYIEALRKKRGRSLRETAHAIGIRSFGLAVLYAFLRIHLITG